MPSSSIKKPVSCECPKSKLFVHSNFKKEKKNRKASRIISWLAGVSLILAYGYGQLFNRIDFTEIIQSKLDHGQVSLVSEKQYQVDFHNDEVAKSSQLVLEKASGYGGPLITGPVINEDGGIDKVFLVHDRETHSFIRKLEAYNFFRQFEGKHVSDQFIVGKDIDAVNGATISCVAIANAVRKSAHDYGKEHFNLTYESDEQGWKLSNKDYFAALLLIIASVSVLKGIKWLRYVSLGLSMILLGFYFNSALNVSHFGRVLLGYFPAFMSNIFWFILVFGSIGLAFFFKKNVYCSAMCPFHTVETIMVKIGGMKIKFTPRIQKISKYSSRVLLWLALMLTFVSKNPTIASYEPFAMVFGLEGEGIHWYMLPMVLVGVLLIKDYFCRYFCPVGKGFWYVIKFRKWVDNLMITLLPQSIKKSV